MEIFEKLGIENADELVEQVQNAREELKEVHQIVRVRIKEMTSEERKEAFAGIKKGTVIRAVAARAKIDKVRANILERREIRVEERLNKLEENNKEGIKAAVLEKIKERRELKVQKGGGEE